MFGIWKRKKPEVFTHWYALVPNFESSTADFYAAVEKELADAKVPGLEISREEFAEGGLLSFKREYLRMRRERLVFDICSAPFGTGWFFSWRFAEIPFVLRFWEVLVLLSLLAGSVLLYVYVFGPVIGGIVFGVTALALLVFLNNALALGLHDLDAVLLRIPVLGACYEAFLRKESYYREDTRLMYCDLVERIVKDKVEEFTAAKGVKLVDFKSNERLAEEMVTAYLKQIRQ
ncbi:MAG: hypothetical protein WCH57_01305 [Verrucomicrobiota bacterium]